VDQPNELSPCPVETAIRLVGGKWKLLLIRVLLQTGPQRFNELSRALPEISHKVLTQNLRELEEARIVEHEGATYGVTAAGAGLMPILHALGQWSESLEPAVQREIAALRARHP